MEVPLYSIDGLEVGKVPLNDAVFGIKVRPYVIHQVEVAYLAGLRRGTACVKTRAEVSGGGKKPWKQKGTGRARAGSTRAPHWKGGGVAFGPRPRSYTKNTPTQLRQQAMVFALADKAQSGKVLVVEPLQLKGTKTKVMVQTLRKLPMTGNVLVLLPSMDREISRACQNIPWVEVGIVRQLNIHSILKCDHILIVKDALQLLEEALCRN